MRGIKWVAWAGLIVAALAAGAIGTRWALAVRGADAVPARSSETAHTQTTVNEIAALERYLERNPHDAEQWAQLGAAFLQRVRENGDPANYARAADALHHAQDLAPNDLNAALGLANLALARHEFELAIRWAEQARAINPDNAGVYGILGDSYLGLGNYGAAFAQYQTMVNTRPDLASYARVAMAREMMGDHAGAIQNMELAVNAGAFHTEARSWALVQLGDLYLNSGKFETAQAHYRAALDNWNGYPLARAALGKVYARQGDLNHAIETYTDLIQTAPLPEFVMALGDLYAAQGDMTRANREYERERELRRQFYVQ